MKKVLLYFLIQFALEPLPAQVPSLQWVNGTGASGFDEVKGMVTDNYGNVYITGAFTGTTDFDPGTGVANLVSTGNTDVFLVRYNSSGAFQWAFNIGGLDDDYATGIVLDDSDRAVICGNFNSPLIDFDPGPGSALASPSGTDFFVAKYDTSGNYVLAFRIGSGSDDSCNGIALDDSSNIIVTGSFNSTMDVDPGPGVTLLFKSNFTSDVFLAKYSSNGIYQWALNIDGSFNDKGSDVIADNSGNIILTGAFRGTNVDFDFGPGTAALTAVDSSDVFIAKYSLAGDYIWAISMGGIENDIGSGLTLDAYGNILVTGSFRNSNVDFDPGTGSSLLSSAGIADIFTASYSPSGIYRWALGAGGSGADEGIAIDVTLAGDIIITGSFSLTADFDPGVNSVNLTSAGNKDAFVAGYDSSGSYQFAFKIGGASDDAGNCIASVPGSFYEAGYFSDTVDFDPGIGIVNENSTGNTDLFISKYHYSPVGTIEFPGRASSYRIFPNPAKDVIQLTPSMLFSEFELEIYSALGCKVKHAINQSSVDLSGLPDGIYLCVVKSGSEIYSREKIVLKKQ